MEEGTSVDENNIFVLKRKKFQGKETFCLSGIISI